jgi:hypothetical protein
VDEGNAYVVGGTTSVDVPTVNPLPFSFGGNGDVFIVKLSPDGSHLLFSSYLGGTAWDVGHAIVVEDAGIVYLTGNTDSLDFPTVKPYDDTFSGGDAFVAKVDTDKSELVYSTFLGGDREDYGMESPPTSEELR